MGTTGEESNAWNEIQRAETDRQIREMERQAELRRLQEEAAKKAAEGQNQMVAAGAETAGQSWPDNEVQAPPSAIDKVAGALRVGAAGDAAFAKQLLDAGRPSADGASAEVGRLDGAKERAAAALTSRATKPAFER